VPITVVTAAERPDLWERVGDLFRELWPEYNHHGDFASKYFLALFPQYAEYQLLVCDPDLDEVVGRGRTIPLRWDGSDSDLPPGIDAAGLRALEDLGPPTALCALAAEVAANRQGQGISRLLVEAMIGSARANGLGPLVAPVRPAWKDRYPITPISSYAYWRRSDGLAFDPWIRVHERLGARIIRPEPRSMRITASVGDWEDWTGLAFPADGSYVFPDGLAPLEISDAVGQYFEPNVWMVHNR
jgi:GNAT superfamily N-acetyltransferase